MTRIPPRPGTPLGALLLGAAVILGGTIGVLLQGGEFASERFSRCGERFCMLTFTLPGSLQERVQQRLELEEAIDRWLVPGRLGCVVGTGAGHAHQYVQLALTDVDAACKHLTQRFAFAKVPGPVRLSFCDSEWKDEWLRLA